MQKKWFIAVIAAAGLVVLLVTASFVMSIINLSQGSTPGTEDVITVYGQGKVSVKPDTAYITLGYENSAPSPKEAQLANVAKMEQISAAVRETGVAEGDIQQAQFNVYQEYYYGDTPDAQSYRVSSIIKVTVRQVDKASDVITAACAAGANTSYGITYDLLNRENVYAEALTLARSRADEKAADLSEELGRKVTGIVEVRESSTAQYDTENLDYGYPGAPTDYVSETASPGGLEISAVVYVTYRLD